MNAPVQGRTDRRDLRAPLKKVRGLGSAKGGTGHFWWQRVTAVALVPLVVGRFNTAFGAGPEHPAGYAPGMWFYTALAALGLLFSYLLWRAESGPAAHGLEYPSGEKPA